MLITTEFEHGNLVPGILEVEWRWWKWLLESRKAGNLSVIVVGVMGHNSIPIPASMLEEVSTPTVEP